MAATIIECSVDQDGYTRGFRVDFDVESFGENLRPGTEVTLDDGEPGVIQTVYSRIQTGPAGVSNYVAVDIAVDDPS